jgi:glycine betaine/proline transport system ATP-binding protein
MTRIQKKFNKPAKRPVVELKNVWKIFGQHSKAAMHAIRNEGLTKKDVHERFQCVVGVQNASLSIHEGEIFCIMGLSGSGKSTLIRHINRLIEPTCGTISINGVNVGKLNPAALRKLRAEQMGMVFQSMALFPHRTVRDNVAFSLELRGVHPLERGKVADKMLNTVGLDGWGDRLPDELSGGMQQRVGLARAMAADPAILLMDEPFSALDPLIRGDLQEEFMALSKVMRKTTVFITHDLDEAIRIGSRIAIMKDGKIIQIGTPEQIVTAPADDYVADFVKDISRLKLVTAGSVMEPIGEWIQDNGHPSCGWTRANVQMDLDGLIGLAADTGEHIIIEDQGDSVGVVTKLGLLRGIRGSANNDH